MKSLVHGLMAPAVLALAVTASAANASPISGMWRAPTNGALIEVSDCGSGVCGKVVTSEHIKRDPGALDVRNKDASLRGRPLKGLLLFDGMTGGPKVWTGKVYNPDDGGLYSGKVTMEDADTLNLRGCIVFPLCKTEKWTRQH